MEKFELIFGTVVIIVFSLLTIFVVFCQYMDYKSDEADRKAECVRSLYRNIDEIWDCKSLLRVTTNGVIVEAPDNNNDIDVYKYAYEHFGIYFMACLGKGCDPNLMYDFYYYDKKEKMVCKIHATFKDFINKYENLIKKYS